ncbi:delta-1-pyrroline-5-carboxylate dehydrogenase [Terriglobus saanensis SP1PR4]|uniref:L-glutamate gamma-semialdehyde dehydrogenase n=2 Tax=Terriglobus saanensis TaxID=870903 RepID=E8V8T2_TERSS|nr:delta-1-pyrroline-5-carboxylate dehydrogenase [Terriglobus saanensis SP1PR4]
MCTILDMTTSANTSLPVFANEPFCDFSDAKIAQQMREAIQHAESRLTAEKYPLVLNGEEKTTKTEIVSVNPARPSQTIGVYASADASHVPSAVASASKAFASWSAQSTEKRADLLLRAASLLRERKMEFNAWLVLEAGKNWGEADADTAEAIDFLEYYALQAIQLAHAKPSIQYPGEENQLVYLPLGVGAVLPPWNFPLAIMAGMTCAAIVMGNTVVLKPSPLTPTIALRFVELLLECGLPEGVVTLCQGGPEFGDALVGHPEVQFIAFTGSKKVGLHIHAKAAQTQPGQRGIKRTILELGGKDGIIVDADADLESAANGVVASAFGFNGQKCSACSRVIVDQSVHDEFVEMLKTRVAALAQGDPVENFATGPVANDAAYDRVLGYIQDGATRGTIVAGGHAKTKPEDGYYIEPTVITGLTSSDRLCQEEIFGPVLTVIAAKDFDDALRIANDTEYGLTGAIYSSSEEKLHRAAREFHVGNLYFNRKCTGAMVGAHPFGGFKMSGTDSKAGGPDYLHLFSQAKSIARKLA